MTREDENLLALYISILGIGVALVAILVWLIFF
jgi:hypothetical protein